MHAKRWRALGALAIAVLACAGPAAAAATPQRAWEIVSPEEKHGGQIGGNVPGIEAAVAPDGERVAYGGVYPLEGSRSGSFSGFRASRTATGWENESVLPAPGENQIGGGFPGLDAVLRGSTSDGEVSVYFDNTTSPHGSLWVLRGDGSRVRIADASVTLITFNLGPLFGAGPGQPWFHGISADGKHVVFTSTDALVPGVTPSGANILYEWVDDGSSGGLGTLRVVNRTNDPAITLLAPAHAALGGSAPHRAANDINDGALRNAISSDGSRIFFQNPAAADGPEELPQGGGPLYVREDGAVTTEVSAPAPGHAPSSAPTLVQYLDASADGRLVYFWADGDLVPGAPASGGIYRYDVDGAALAFVAEAAPAAGLPTAMASADGSRLYFEDGGTIKLHHSGTTSLVFSGTPQNSRAGALPGLREDGCVTANVSPDGRFFAFSARVNAAQPLQVYRYDAQADALTQVSVGPMAPATYDAGWYGTPSCGALTYPARARARVMSDDGQYVFFDTAAALVPGDSNGRLDVYEWHDGSVSLVSSGRSAAPAELVGTDGSGRNAFFTTTEPLAPQDGDVAYDLYDARIGGGFPLPPRRPLCTGDGCQGAAAPGLSAPSAASATYRGAGNARRVQRAQSAGVRAGRVSPRAKRALVRRGVLVLPVQTTRAGTVHGRLLLRAGRRWVPIGGGARSVRRAGRALLRMEASAGGAARLARAGGRARIRVRIRFSGSRATQTTTFVVSRSAGGRTARAGGQ